MSNPERRGGLSRTLAEAGLTIRGNGRRRDGTLLYPSTEWLNNPHGLAIDPDSMRALRAFQYVLSGVEQSELDDTGSRTVVAFGQANGTVVQFLSPHIAAPPSERNGHEIDVVTIASQTHIVDYVGDYTQYTERFVATFEPARYDTEVYLRRQKDREHQPTRITIGEAAKKLYEMYAQILAAEAQGLARPPLTEAEDAALQALALSDPQPEVSTPRTMIAKLRTHFLGNPL